MFAVRVENRSTVQQVLESEWMVKWALPDMQRAIEQWENGECTERDGAGQVKAPSEFQEASQSTSQPAADKEIS